MHNIRARLRRRKKAEQPQDNRNTELYEALALMEKPDNKSAKIQAHVPGENLVIERTARTFEEAITECVDLMKEKMVRNREKRNNE